MTALLLFFCSTSLSVGVALFIGRKLLTVRHSVTGTLHTGLSSLCRAGPRNLWLRLCVTNNLVTLKTFWSKSAWILFKYKRLLLSPARLVSP